MTFIAVTLMAAWIWMFLSNFNLRLPSWLIHLTVIPAIAYISLHAPPETQRILGVAGGVMLVQSVFKSDTPTTRLPVRKRTSNIPPPP